jgi:putative nucleotidyltransferase with HDIG domain
MCAQPGKAGRAVVSKIRRKIDTAYVEMGMYISRLDRPWLATPFVLQGFEVTDETELKQLREFCRYVYVDPERGSMPAAEIDKRMQRVHDAASLNIIKHKYEQPEASSLPDRLLMLINRAFGLKLGARRRYKSRVSTRKEAPQALKAHNAATALSISIIEQVRNGGTVDLEQVRDAVGPIIDSILRNPDTMTWLVSLKKRDEYAYKHSIATSVWAVVLGRHLGFDRDSLEILAVGGLLLDIGKTQIPVEVLAKETELTDFECRQIRDHVRLGVKLAEEAKGIGQEVLDMIASHHERHDGSGYPDGTSGAEIPVFGRIAGIVDAYDAMITTRPYAEAMSPYDAVRDLNGRAGKEFQPQLVEQFVQAMGMFPSGCLVELNTGEVGIVIEQNRVRRLRPKVLVLLDERKQALEKQSVKDLRKLPSDARQANACWIVQGLEPGSFGIDPRNHFL